MSDLIDRQAAIDAIEKTKTAVSPDGERYVAKINAQMNVQLLPSAQTEQHGVCMGCAIRNICKFKSGLGDYGYCSQWTKIEVE